MYCSKIGRYTNSLKIFSADKAVKYLQHCRHETASVYVNDAAHGPEKAQWNKVIREAEDIVECPKSFVDLKDILNINGDKRLSHNFKKLAGIDHPVIKTVKDILYKENDNLQPWGLIVLLLSKAVNYNVGRILLSEDKVGGVRQTQRSVAQVTEIFRNLISIHKGVVNVSRTNRTPEEDTIMTGNKFGILLGDYLRITANEILTKMRKPDIHVLMFSAYRDLTEAEFLGDRDSQNLPVPAAPARDKMVMTVDYQSRTGSDPVIVGDFLGHAEEEWTVHHTLSTGSLLGRGCQCAMILAEKPEDLQNKAYAFGCHLALAWQASHDLNKFNFEESETFSLISAPVLYALQCNRDIYSTFIEPARADVTHVDYNKLREAVKKTAALDMTKYLLDEHRTKARDFLKTIGNDKAVRAINDILSAM